MRLIALTMFLALFLGLAYDLTHNQPSAWSAVDCHTDSECAELSGNGDPD